MWIKTEDSLFETNKFKIVQTFHTYKVKALFDESKIDDELYGWCELKRCENKSKADMFLRILAEHINTDSDKVFCLEDY